MPDKPLEQELLETRKRNQELQDRLFREPMNIQNKWHSISIGILFGLFVVTLVLSVINFGSSSSVRGRIPQLESRITVANDKANKNEGALQVLQDSVTSVNTRLDLLGFTDVQSEAKK